MAKNDDKMSADELAELLAEGEGDEELSVQDDLSEDEGDGDIAELEVAADDDPPEGEHPALAAQKPQVPVLDLAAMFAVPENATEKITEIDQKIAAIKAEWDAGDIGDQQFTTQIEALAMEKAGIKARMDAVEAARDASEKQRAEAEDAQWESAVASFRASNPTLWKDDHRPRFNEHVKVVTADPRYASLAFDQQLVLAANFYASERSALGLDAPPIQKAKAGKAAKPQARPALPPTLARVPAAEQMEVGLSAMGERFAQIDRMSESGDVDGAERVLASLNAAEREMYLQGQG